VAILASGHWSSSPLAWCYLYRPVWVSARKGHLFTLPAAVATFSLICFPSTTRTRQRRERLVAVSPVRLTRDAFCYIHYRCISNIIQYSSTPVQMSGNKIFKLITKFKNIQCDLTTLAKYVSLAVCHIWCVCAVSVSGMTINYIDWCRGQHWKILPWSCVMLPEG